MQSCGCDVKARAKALMGGGTVPFVMATVDADGKPCMRWMGAYCPDPNNEWILYSACFSGSRKTRQIAANCHMQLMFTSVDYSEVATLIGIAEKVDCPETKKLIWDTVPACADYFSAPDGEDFGVIKFTTKRLELLAMDEKPEPYRLDV